MWILLSWVLAKTIVEQGIPLLDTATSEVESQEIEIMPEWQDMVVAAPQVTGVPEHFDKKLLSYKLNELIQKVGPVLCEADASAPVCYSCKNQDNLFEYRYYFSWVDSSCTITKYSIKRKEASQLKELQEFLFKKQIVLPQEFELPLTFEVEDFQVDLVQENSHFKINLIDSKTVSRIVKEREEKEFLLKLLERAWSDYLEHTKSYIAELEFHSEVEIEKVVAQEAMERTDTEILGQLTNILTEAKKRKAEGKACYFTQNRNVLARASVMEAAKEKGLLVGKPWIDSFLTELKGTVCGNFAILEWIYEQMRNSEFCDLKSLDTMLKYLSYLDAKKMPPLEKDLYKLLSFTLDLRQASFGEKINFETYKKLEALKMNSYLETRIQSKEVWKDAGLLNCGK